MNDTILGGVFRRRSLALELLWTIGLVTSACARSGEDTMTGNTMTEQQAAQQVQTNIHAAAGQLPVTTSARHRCSSR
jgi:hypothetical protein